MQRPKITITLVEQKGIEPCHRGHKIGDSFDFDLTAANCARWPCTWPSPLWKRCATAASCPPGRMVRSVSAARMWT